MASNQLVEYFQPSAEKKIEAFVHDRRYVSEVLRSDGTIHGCLHCVNYPSYAYYLSYPHYHGALGQHHDASCKINVWRALNGVFFFSCSVSGKPRRPLQLHLLVRLIPSETERHSKIDGYSEVRASQADELHAIMGTDRALTSHSPAFFGPV